MLEQRTGSDVLSIGKIRVDSSHHAQESLAGARSHALEKGEYGTKTPPRDLGRASAAPRIDKAKRVKLAG
jgi:hypothetical protein